MLKKAIVVVSGGLDSVTLAYLLNDKEYQLTVLSFDYGQRHRKELRFAKQVAERLAADYQVVDLSSLGQLLSGSALTDDIAVPDGHYAEETMKITVVPNRNAIMLSIAYGVAVAQEADIVAFGAHTGDHFIYPDCRSRFVNAFDVMQAIAVEGYGNPNLRLYTPFIELSKHDIVTIGHNLQVPFEDTWSCYKGGVVHCGTCGTCVERREAFLLANVVDPTVYEAEPEFLG